MTSTPTALWVVPVPDFGGVARHVVDMARAGLPGFNLVVLAPEGKLTSRLEELGVTVIKAEFGPDYGFKTSFALCRRLLSSSARTSSTATWRMRTLSQPLW